MGSLTKKQREQQEEVKIKIMDGKRRGVCDGEGRSVRNAAGVYVAVPRTFGVRRRWVWDRKANRLVEVT